MESRELVVSGSELQNAAKDAGIAKEILEAKNMESNDQVTCTSLIAHRKRSVLLHPAW